MLILNNYVWFLLCHIGNPVDGQFTLKFWIKLFLSWSSSSYSHIVDQLLETNIFEHYFCCVVHRLSNNLYIFNRRYR